MTDETAAQSQPISDDGNSSGNEKVFDFFGLPAELRDMIYAMLTEIARINTVQTLEEDAAEDIVIMENLMLPQCLLLNKQFKDEYEGQVQPYQHLIFQDLSYEVACFDLHGVAKAASRFTLHLLFECSKGSNYSGRCSCLDDLRYHTAWIQKTFDQLSNIGDIKFKIYFDPGSTVGYKHENNVAEQLRRAVGTGVNVQMEMYRFKEDDDFEVPVSYEENRPIVARWHRKEGWQPM